jgi:hypothetical protein
LTFPLKDIQHCLNRGVGEVGLWVERFLHCLDIARAILPKNLHDLQLEGVRKKSVSCGQPSSSPNRLGQQTRSAKVVNRYLRPDRTRKFVLI